MDGYDVFVANQDYGYPQNYGDGLNDQGWAIASLVMAEKGAPGGAGRAQARVARRAVVREECSHACPSRRVGGATTTFPPQFEKRALRTIVFAPLSRAWTRGVVCELRLGRTGDHWGFCQRSLVLWMAQS